MSEIAIWELTSAVTVALLLILPLLLRFVFPWQLRLALRRNLSGATSRSERVAATAKSIRQVKRFYTHTYAYAVLAVMFGLLFGLQIFRSP